MNFLKSQSKLQGLKTYLYSPLTRKCQIALLCSPGEKKLMFIIKMPKLNPNDRLYWRILSNIWYLTFLSMHFELMMVLMNCFLGCICQGIHLKSGPVFSLLLGVSSDYTKPITGKVIDVTCPVIIPAQPELALSKRHKTGPLLTVWPETTHPIHPCAVYYLQCGYCPRSRHDDVIKWKHLPRYWPFVRGIHRSPVNSPHKGQWRGALMFTLSCARINGWVNNREAGDLRRHHGHYDVIVMIVMCIVERLNL